VDQASTLGSSAGSASTPGGATIVRNIPVESDLGQKVARESKDGHVKVGGESSEERQARKLSLLLDISKELSKQQEVDKLLEKVVDITFQVMNVDRVSILLVEGDAAELVPRMSKNRLGYFGGQHRVPQSIARRAVNERLAILTDNAAADERFKGKSILMQSVRSAMCVPLLGSDGKVLGIIYVDNMTATNSFNDEDLEFLIAFSGITAVAIENNQLTDRVRREAVCCRISSATSPPTWSSRSPSRRTRSSSAATRSRWWSSSATSAGSLRCRRRWPPTRSPTC
jgi:transcriptional regulator with GAF, ATPase, and Fis domain